MATRRPTEPPRSPEIAKEIPKVIRQTKGCPQGAASRAC